LSLRGGFTPMPRKTSFVRMERTKKPSRLPTKLHMHPQKSASPR
jgi:hypothetical protein